MQLTRLIAENIVNTRYRDLTVEARETAKRSVLDTLGVMFPAAAFEPGCASLADMVRDAGGKEESTIISFGGKVPCWMAALVNGSLAHPMDYDEVMDKHPGHPAGSTFPAALAVAERVGRVSGKDFITAMAVATDLAVRLASAPRAPKAKLLEGPWFPITTFGIFAATAAAGKVLGLSAEQMVNALGIAFQRVSGNIDIGSPDSELRAIRDGFTNKEGVLSALMASKGITASRDSIEKLYKFYYQDEYHPEVLTAELGTRFRGAEVSLKGWPSCRATHGYIQAALDLARENNIKLDQIEEVTVTVVKFVADSLCEPAAVKRSPKLSIDAKFSVPFTVGVALAKGNVVIADFLPENLGDPRVLEIAGKVKYRVDSQFTTTVVPAPMEIRTRDGKVFSKTAEVAYGHPQNPLSRESLIAKFKDCAQYARKPLAPERTDGLIEKILKLEQVKDMKEITAWLA